MYYKAPIQQRKSFAPHIIVLILLLVLAILFLLHSTSSTEEISIQPIRLPNAAPAPQHYSEPTPQISSNKKLVFTIKPGENLSSIFEEAGLNNKTLINILSQCQHKALLKNVQLKQKLNFVLSQDNELLKLSFDPSPKQRLIVQRNEDGTYSSELHSLKTKHQKHYISATIKDSLYETALRHKIPQALLIQLTQIFSRHINFSKDIRNNDRLTLIYQTDHIKDGPSKVGKILAAKYTGARKNYTAVRYQKFNKETDYFTPDGRSLKLNFDRYPIKYTHISSHFDSHRRHPILNIVRPHRGIDLAAHQGTEIHAVADGIINQIGTSSGYGKSIKIKHTKKYETVYAHMLKFKPSLHNGSYVKRGEVIGYVGQTGLATAPHCHFEFRINGAQVDPATISLPTAPDISQKSLFAFKQKTQSLLDQLTLYESAQLASNN